MERDAASAQLLDAENGGYNAATRRVVNENLPLIVGGSSGRKIEIVVVGRVFVKGEHAVDGADLRRLERGVVLDGKGCETAHADVINWEL